MKHHLLIAASLFALSSGCNMPTGIRIKVVNDSGKPIETVKFWNLEEDRSTLITTAGPIAPNKQKRVLLNNMPGESSHATEVIFEDGTLLKNEGTYAEGGYSLTETITTTEIVIDYGRY